MTPPDLGIYVHWPYCARICPYCDFNVRRNRSVDENAWITTLTRDIAYWADRIEKRTLQSLYFGGGTPSLAPVSVLSAVVDAAHKAFGFEDGAEITLEANPNDITQGRVEAWRAIGINRLSLGVQSFNDEKLRFLGRDHDGQGAHRAAETARRLMETISLDLIYGLPNQSMDEWDDDVKTALSLHPDHLSLYQLTIEPGTAFDAAVARNAWRPISSDREADFYTEAQNRLEAAGLPGYETSNHARIGRQARHNMIYWRYQDYIGIGPGAHGRLTIAEKRIATEAALDPQEYLSSGAIRQSAYTEEILSKDAALLERISMGLRLVSGIALREDDVFFADATRERRLKALIDDHMLIHEDGVLKATEQGRPLLNAILANLFT